MFARTRQTMHSASEKFIACAAGCTTAAVILVLVAGMMLNAGCVNRPATVTGATADPVADPTEIENSIGMWLAPVSPGEFLMGSPPDEPGRDTDETQHKVRITRPFYLGVYPVTQSQYAAVMGTNPSYFRGEGDKDFPVESVSWFDAVAFCRKLSAREGRTYRLPTEAEWEYACRAGATGPYAGDGKLGDIGWYLGNAGDTTHPVGLLQPNDWGLYDMQGNVWEWVADWYGHYPPGDGVDPTGPATGTTRVLRGGTIDYDAEYARAAFRNYYTPDEQIYYIGFRVAMDAQ